jgi:hypothetical protein
VIDSRPRVYEFDYVAHDLVELDLSPTPGYPIQVVPAKLLPQHLERFIEQVDLDRHEGELIRLSKTGYGAEHFPCGLVVLERNGEYRDVEQHRTDGLHVA